MSPPVWAFVATVAQVASDEPVPQSSWVGPVLFLAILLGIVVYVVRRNRRP